MRVLAIHHEDWKLYLLRAASRQKHRNLGILEDELRAASVDFDYHEAATGQPLRDDLSRYSHLVVLGGNMSAHDDESHPFLREEIRILEDALGRGIPVLGICLGAQLLARVHGARVAPGVHGPELAWHSIMLTEEGQAEPLLQGFPAESPVFQWHHDTFELPTGAVRLARSAVYENQAFRVGQTVWGFQFHLEANQELIRAWLRTYGPVHGGEALEAARAATERCLAGYTTAARTFMRGFLGLTRAATPPA